LKVDFIDLALRAAKAPVPGGLCQGDTAAYSRLVRLVWRLCPPCRACIAAGLLVARGAPRPAGKARAAPHPPKALAAELLPFPGATMAELAEKVSSYQSSPHRPRNRPQH